ncbi:PQQ-binding-like beta-propeller repeat protein [Streptomyces yokosukanensis]|uniref:protein kinase domain-containing protein n=1 Tax=Streptomyces yokosukanensis TaxID=67386 RepID=UPI00341C74E0
MDLGWGRPDPADRDTAPRDVRPLPGSPSHGPAPLTVIVIGAAATLVLAGGSLGQPGGTHMRRLPNALASALAKLRDPWSSGRVPSARWLRRGAVVEPLRPEDPRVLGAYRMIGRLGAGGMGRVYLARSGGGRTVAVKVVRADLAEDGEFRRRFRHEVEVARAVSGPYTAPVVDADTDGPLPWLATAYVLGPSLEDVVAQHGPLPETSVWALAGGLAEALRGIHGAGLVHRDLKPSNILLTADGPRVIDFGIARAIDGERLTSTGVVVGSPGFMSPEQAMGKVVGPEGDVFSLGIVLAYSASGQMPFGMAAAASLLYQVVHEQPDVSGVPEALRALVVACLVKDPARRPTPEQIADGVARLGFSVVAGSWLPTQVASTIAQHAARILDLDTPPEGSSPVATARPSYTPTQVVPSSGGSGGADSASGTSSRRRFLTAAATVGAVGLIGGGAAYALMPGGKQKPKPGPTGSGTPAPRRTQWPGGVASATWAYPGGDPKNSLVAASGGTVILPQRRPVGLAAATGRVTWSDPGTFRWTTGLLPMLVTASAVVALDQKSRVIQADPATGKPTWQWPQPSNLAGIAAFVAADDKAIYVFGSGSPTTDGPDPGPGKRRTVLLSIDIGTRLERWRVPIDGKKPVTLSLGTVSDGHLAYTDDATNALNVRDTADGRLAWSVPVEEGGALPAVDNGTVFTTDRHVVAYTLATGRKKWTALSHSSDVGFSAPQVKDGVLYVSDGRGVHALDASDGRQIWSRNVDGGTNGIDLVVTDTGVYVTSDDQSNGVYALDRRTGEIVWNFRTSQSSASDGIWELADGGKCIVACSAGHVFGLPAV